MQMRNTMTRAVAAALSVAVLGGLTLASARAADIPMPQQQAQMPGPGYYGPPPAAPSYGYPPPVVYGYPPPPPVAYYGYAAPAYWAYPGYWRGPYWRGYGPRFAYGYGRWGRGFRR
jgi:hypothetical protein